MKKLVRKGSAVTAGELTEYLANYPADQEVLLGIIDITGERKYMFHKTDFVFVTDSDKPFMLIGIDTKNPQDVTNGVEEPCGKCGAGFDEASPYCPDCAAAGGTE